MECPYCGAKTEVTETRGPFRDRHCTNRRCGFIFTTREQVMTDQDALAPGQHRRQCARTCAAHFKTSAGASLPGAKAGSKTPTERWAPTLVRKRRMKQLTLPYGDKALG